MPGLSTVHIDTALTNVSIAYKNENFIGELVAPVLPVEKRSNKYFVYDKAMFLQGSGLDANGKPKSLRRPKTEANVIDYTLSNKPYYCEEYAHRNLVSDAEVKIADSPLQPDIDATLQVTEQLALDNEMATAALTCTSTNYPTANKTTLTTGGSGTSWASYTSANSLPLNNLKDAKVQVIKSIMRQPNCAMYTIDSAQVLADHPTIKDLIKYVHSDALTMGNLPVVVRGLMTIEGGAQKMTSADGAATQTSGNVWVDENGYNVCLVFYRSKDVGPRSIHHARTFDAPDDTTGVRGFSIRRYRWEPLKGQWIEGSMTRDWKFVAVDANDKGVGGYLISGTTL